MFREWRPESKTSATGAGTLIQKSGQPQPCETGNGDRLEPKILADRPTLENGLALGDF
jgi:hypothetical protein